MHYGLFGKLPSRRDFISQGAPRAFLRLWEPWVDQGLGAMRASLGPQHWEGTFRTSPIWRFWLGSEICGEAMFGALMPSMDAVGRYFPLTAICLGDQTPLPSPPNVDAHHGWFMRLEDVMLEALDPHNAPEEILAKLASLDPAQAPDDAPEPLYSSLHPDKAPSRLTDLFAACRVAYPCNMASASFWWTLGGTQHRPTAFIRQNLPEPDMMAAMMTAHFEPEAEAAAELPHHFETTNNIETDASEVEETQQAQEEPQKPQDGIAIGIETS